MQLKKWLVGKKDTSIDIQSVKINLCKVGYQIGGIVFEEWIYTKSTEGLFEGIRDSILCFYMTSLSFIAYITDPKNAGLMVYMFKLIKLLLLYIKIVDIVSKHNLEVTHETSWAV